MEKLNQSRREALIENIGGVSGVVMSIGVGTIISEVICAVLPAPVKVGAKIVRAIGTAGISLIIEEKCNEVAKNNVENIFDTIDDVKELHKLSKKEKEKKKELKQIKKRYDKESKKMRKKMHQTVDDTIDAGNEIIHNVHKMCVSAVENAN